MIGLPTSTQHKLLDEAFYAHVSSRKDHNSLFDFVDELFTELYDQAESFCDFVSSETAVLVFATVARDVLLTIETDFNQNPFANVLLECATGLISSSSKGGEFDTNEANDLIEFANDLIAHDSHLNDDIKEARAMCFAKQMLDFCFFTLMGTFNKD